MATKVTLGKRPETFAPFPVKFTLPDGSPAVVKTTYRYRTRTEFGKLLNTMFAAAGKEAPAVDPAEPAKPVDFEALFAETGEKNAEHLLDSIAAWDADIELTLPDLVELCDTMPAAAAAFLEAYSTACNTGRLGN